MKFRPLATAAVLAFSFAVAACGGESTTTVIEKTVTETAPAAQTEASTVEESAPEETEALEASSSPTDGGSITVPNVVGKDHQLAQDTMQAAGLYNLSEEDATGQGRMLLLDRNWVVVEQDPPAGSKVNDDTTIVLSSKKKGE